MESSVGLDEQLSSEENQTDHLQSSVGVDEQLSSEENQTDYLQSSVGLDEQLGSDSQFHLQPQMQMGLARFPAKIFPFLSMKIISCIFVHFIHLLNSPLF